MSISTLAQAATGGALLANLGAGTLIVAVVCAVAGFVSGYCIWRKDRQRIGDAERVTAELQARIDRQQSSAHPSP